MAIARTLTQTAFYALSIALARGVSIFMLPYLTSHLTKAEYGQIDLMASIADVTTVILGFGLVDALYRFAGGTGSLDARKAIAASAFGLILSLGFGAFILLQIFSPLLELTVGGEVDPIAMRLLLGSIALDGAIQVPLTWLRLSDRAGFFALANGVRAGLQAVFSVIGVELEFGIRGVMGASLLAAFTAAFILGIRQAQETGIRIERHQWFTLMRYGGPLVIGGLGGFALGSFNRILLSHFVPLETIGIYGIANRLAMLTPLAFQPFGLWWFPRRLTLLGEEMGLKRSAKIVSFALVYLMLIGLGVALGGPVLIVTLTPLGYHTAQHYLPWLIMATLLQHAGDLLNVGSFTGHTTNRPMAINLSSAGVAIALYYILIPPYGADGAMIATVIAYLFQLVVFFHDSQRAVTLHLPWARLGLFFIFCVCLAQFLPVEPNIIEGGLLTAAALVVAACFALGLRLVEIPGRGGLPGMKDGHDGNRRHFKNHPF